jgi:hypothetical protein
MSEFFRVASIAGYEPNTSFPGNVRASNSAPLVRDEVSFDDFSTAMLFGANFRASGIRASRIRNSSVSVEAALQLSKSPLMRHYIESAQFRDGSVTPSRAEGVTNNANSL